MRLYVNRSVKGWIEQPPSVDEVRPNHCQNCNTTSVRNGVIWVQGHGTRSRNLGITDEMGCGVDCILKVRRYQCKACGAVCVVSPEGISSRRYTSAAIALAFYYWAIERCSEIEVRRKISTDSIFGHGTCGKWPVLRRWVKAAKQLLSPLQDLFGSFRDQAAAIVRWIAAQAPPLLTDAPLREQVLRAACSLVF